MNTAVDKTIDKTRPANLKIPMTEEHFRALRTLILDQGAKIAELSLEVRNLKKALETTEVVVVEDETFSSAELLEMFKTRQFRARRSDN